MLLEQDGRIIIDVTSKLYRSGKDTNGKKRFATAGGFERKKKPSPEIFPIQKCLFNVSCFLLLIPIPLLYLLFGKR